MQHSCVFDIETIPTQSDEIKEKLKGEITPPGTIKKQESIDKWLEENLESATQEKIDKTSFDPAYGHICTIAWAFDDDEPVAVHARTVDEERAVLGSFFSAINMHDKGFNSIRFAGHYISGFDIRFVLCRAVVLGLKIPKIFPRDPKPWSKDMFDTMIAWSGVKGSIKMDELSLILGGNGKTAEFHGSKVAQAWANGEHQTIIDYCKQDVAETREIYRKFQAVGF